MANKHKSAEPTTAVTPAIEVSTIRLTAGETRSIMRAASSDVPVHDYGEGPGLAAMGIMKRVPVNTEQEKKSKRNECWDRVKKAASREDLKALGNGYDELSRLTRDRDQFAYVLTDLGKQIARGVTVRLNSQYRIKR